MQNIQFSLKTQLALIFGSAYTRAKIQFWRYLDRVSRRSYYSFNIAGAGSQLWHSV